MLEDRAPELRVAAGDARRVTEAAAREVAPGGIALREKRAERGSEDLRQMADVRDDFVVAGGFDCRGGGAEIAPEFQDGRSGGRCGVSERCDEARAALEELSGAVFPAGFFRAGHRVRADEMGVGPEGGRAEAGDFVFDAADVGHDRAGGEVGCDLAGKEDDLINGGGDDDEGGASDGGLRGFGDGVAPRLAGEGEAGFGAAGPDHDALRDVVGASGPGDGGAE